MTERKLLAHDYAQQIMSTLYIDKITYNGTNISIVKDETEIYTKYGDDYLGFLFRELIDLIPPFVSRYGSPNLCSLSITYVKNKYHEFGNRIKYNIKLNQENLFLEFRKLFVNFKHIDNPGMHLNSFVYDSNCVDIPVMKHLHVASKDSAQLEQMRKRFQEKCYDKIGMMPPNCYLKVKYR